MRPPPAVQPAREVGARQQAGEAKRQQEGAPATRSANRLTNRTSQA